MMRTLFLRRLRAQESRYAQSLSTTRVHTSSTTSYSLIVMEDTTKPQWYWPFARIQFHLMHHRSKAGIDIKEGESNRFPGR